MPPPAPVTWPRGSAAAEIPALATKSLLMDFFFSFSSCFLSLLHFLFFFLVQGDSFLQILLQRNISFCLF